MVTRVFRDSGTEVEVRRTPLTVLTASIGSLRSKCCKKAGLRVLSVDSSSDSLLMMRVPRSDSTSEAEVARAVPDLDRAVELVEEELVARVMVAAEEALIVLLLVDGRRVAEEEEASSVGEEEDEGPTAMMVPPLPPFA